MGCQEVLIVRVLQITDHNRTARHEDVLLELGMQMDRIDDFAAKSDRKIKFSALALRRSRLTQSAICNVWLGWRSDLGLS